MSWTLNSFSEAKTYSQKSENECDKELVDEIKKFLKKCALISKEISQGDYPLAVKHCESQLNWLKERGYTYYHAGPTRFIMDENGEPVCVIPEGYSFKIYKSPILTELWNRVIVDELTGEGEKEMQTSFKNLMKNESYNEWLEKHIIFLRKESETVENKALKIRKAKRLSKKGEVDKLSDDEKMLVMSKNNQMEFDFG